MGQEELANSETGEGSGALCASCSSTIGWPAAKDTTLRNLPHPRAIHGETP